MFGELLYILLHIKIKINKYLYIGREYYINKN